MGDKFTQAELAELNLIEPVFSSVPEQLQRLPMALWVAEPELDATGNRKKKTNGKPRIKKAPRNSRGFYISKSKLDQWDTFEHCCATFDPDRFTGIGCLIQTESGIVGIDLDDINALRSDVPGIQELLERTRFEQIYCETSPSGAGLRLFVMAKLPKSGGVRKGGIELYSDAAFLTITGKQNWPGEIKPAQWLVDELLSLVGRSTETMPSQEIDFINASQKDENLVSALTEWATANIQPLWTGNWQGFHDELGHPKYPSQSEADMSVISRLTKEALRRGYRDEIVAGSVFAAFKESGLYRPEKENQIQKYAIPKAIDTQCGGQNLTITIPPEIVEVNNRFALIEALGIYDKKIGGLVKLEQFGLLYRNRIINIGTTLLPKYTTLDKVWLASDSREQYCGLELRPDCGQRTDTGALNVYRGFSCPPVKGDVQPFLDLMAWLIPNESDRNYFHAFLAYKIKNPISRYAQAAVLWSITQGVGKNLLVETWASLFDSAHWGVVGQEVFADGFTEWQHRKLIVIADEVSSTDSRTASDRIKGWITASQNRINEKGLPRFQEPNLTAYVFLSNHPDAVFIDDTDRRFWVAECPTKRPEPALISNFVAWRDTGGRSYLLNHFLEFDTGSFDPRTPAPMTSAKQEMIEDNKSDLERWINGLLTRENIPKSLGRALVTVEELTQNYRSSTSRDISSRAMNSALRRAGVVRLQKQARRKDGTRPRVYALENANDYERMTDSELGAMLDRCRFMPIGATHTG